MPTTKMLQAALDAIDVGIALAGRDGRLLFCNAAYADFLAVPRADLAEASLFGLGCPCGRFLEFKETWHDQGVISVSDEAPDGASIDVVVRPALPDSDVRLIVLRRGLVRVASDRRQPPEVLAELQSFVTELTGHDADPVSLSAAPLSVLLLGIEGVDELRAEFGPQAIEQALREVAHALVLQKRKADIISRYGDGQFLVLAPDTPRHGAAMLGERIRNRASAIEIANDDRRLTISLAAYTAEYRPDLDGSMRDLVEQASSAIARSPQHTTV